MDAGVAARATGHGAAGSLARTLVGLFDDRIDAELALAALRKSERPADQISVVVRDRENGDEAERTDVARALVASALDAVGGWLQGLAALIVPERGTFLVAGPIGAALAGIKGDPSGQRGALAVTATGNLDSTALCNTLHGFGFTADEASYLDSRLNAGSTLIAVSLDDPKTLGEMRRFFAEHNAVHIGLAQTDEGHVARVRALMAAPPERSSEGDVLVADAVAPLRRLCHPLDGDRAPACGRMVIDEDGNEIGAVAEVLADNDPGSGSGDATVVRYLVVAYGGVLGIGRHHVVVPIELADVSVVPVRVVADKELVRHAPSFDADDPFSRREEEAVCAYYGVRRYWLTNGEA